MDDSLLYAQIEQLDTELADVPIFLKQLDVYHRPLGREERDAEIWPT